MTINYSDTIAAIATAPGLGGIAIIRLSGKKALEIGQKLVFQPSSSHSVLFKPRFMHFGYVKDQHNNILDEVLAVYMPAPHSATGEDVLEIHCHGGAGVSAAILQATLGAGARLAAAGEFTRRAFMLGRLDLTQAEAVAELIHAPTAMGARLAEAKLQGLFGKKITAIRNSLDALRIQITLAVDFPEEDAELLNPEEFSNTTFAAKKDLEALLASFERARLWREGVNAVLIGQVNAGKSSLFNALLGRERAIVSAQAGTTRDYLEEVINLGGLPLRILDTAGLRQGEDIVEQEGIARSFALASKADLIFLVVDAQKGLEQEEQEFLRRYAHSLDKGKILIVFNKVDMLEDTFVVSESFTLPATATSPELPFSCPAVAVSSLDGQGLDSLSMRVREIILAGGGDLDNSDLAPNLRQSVLLKQAVEELDLLVQDIDKKLPADILGVRLDFLVHTLDTVTGTTDNEVLLDQIFSSFCIGK